MVARRNCVLSSANPVESAFGGLSPRAASAGTVPEAGCELSDDPESCHSGTDAGLVPESKPMTRLDVERFAEPLDYQAGAGPRKRRGVKSEKLANFR